MEPLNYSFQAPNIGDQFLQGLQISQAMQAQKAAQEQAQAKAEADARFQAELQSVANNPNRTVDDYRRLATIRPDLSEKLMKTSEGLAPQERQARVNSIMPIFAAVRGGKLDVAKNLLAEQEEAATNAGNQQGANAARAMRLSLDLDPAGAEFTMANVLGNLDEKFSENYSKLTTSFNAQAAENRTKEQFPDVKRKTAAEAAKAESDVKLTDANVIIKQAEAKFAPQRLGAELGLTQAQIEAVKAQRRASDASAANSMAQARRAQSEANQMGAGVIPADKRPEAESKFRKEYSDQTKGYQEVKSAYSRLLSSDDNAVGDLSLIFGYMKMLDPGSVVREGEFATAQNAAGVPERVLNAYNRALNGERLTPAQRSAFKGQAGKLYSSAQQQEAQVRTGLERIAKGYGLNTSNIFYAPNETAPMPANDVNAKAVPGQRNVIVNY